MSNLSRKPYYREYYNNKKVNSEVMKASNLPIISIIIPVKPDGYVKAIEAVKQLDYPVDKLEVLIAEGNQPSRQRNEAAKKASGEILYFLDDDSLPAPSNLKRLVAHYKNEAVAGVGGQLGPGGACEACRAHLDVGKIVTGFQFKFVNDRFNTRAIPTVQ